MSLLTQQQLRKAGVRATPPRMAVLEALQGNGGQHMTADELYLRLGEQGRAVGLATVYRVLADLEAGGIIRRNQFGQGKARFELAGGGRHFHIVDREGGDVREFEDEALLHRLQEVAAQSGHRLVDLELTLYVRPAPSRAAEATNLSEPEQQT